MESIADEGGEEGVGEEEGGEDKVGEVDRDGLEVFIEPRHGGCGDWKVVLGGVYFRAERFLRLDWGWRGWSIRSL